MCLPHCEQQLGTQADGAFAQALDVYCVGQVDEDLAAQMTAMKTKSQMEIDAAVVRLQANATVVPSLPRSPPQSPPLSRPNLAEWCDVSCVCPLQKHADAAVLDLIQGMPSWVDAEKVEAAYTKAKAAAPTGRRRIRGKTDGSVDVD